MARSTVIALVWLGEGGRCGQCGGTEDDSLWLRLPGPAHSQFTPGEAEQAWGERGSFSSSFTLHSWTALSPPEKTVLLLCKQPLDRLADF